MAAALAVAVGLPAVASVPPDGDLAFRVLRGDSPMGDHRLTFQRDGARLEVLVSIDLDVKLGPFTLYEYTHENREVWRDGRLVRLSTETDDDGESFFVEAQRTDDGLRVETREGSRIVPGDIIPSSYWNYAIVEAEQVLDTQKGRVLDVATRIRRRDRDLGQRRADFRRATTACAATWSWTSGTTPTANG